MERGLRFSLLNHLDQLSILRDQLPQVSHLLQQFGEEVGRLRMVGLEVLVQSLKDAVLNVLHLLHIHESGAV